MRVKILQSQQILNYGVQSYDMFKHWGIDTEGPFPAAEDAAGNKYAMWQWTTWLDGQKWYQPIPRQDLTRLTHRLRDRAFRSQFNQTTGPNTKISSKISKSDTTFQHPSIPKQTEGLGTSSVHWNRCSLNRYRKQTGKTTGPSIELRPSSPLSTSTDLQNTQPRALCPSRSFLLFCHLC